MADAFKELELEDGQSALSAGDAVANLYGPLRPAVFWCHFRIPRVEMEKTAKYGEKMSKMGKI